MKWAWWKQEDTFDSLCRRGAQAADPVDAIACFRKALELEPGHRYAMYAWSCLGNAYSKLGQHAEAIAAYRKALEFEPNWGKDSWYILGYGIGPGDVWYNIAITYHKQDQIAEAIAAYREAVRLKPDDVISWYNLGIAHGEMGQHTEGISAYREALRLQPESLTVLHNLGVAYAKKGEIAEAISAFCEALRLDPDYPEVAKRQSPSPDPPSQVVPDADSWYDAGSAYARQGQSNQAIAAFRQAVHIQPDHIAAWYNLGVEYSKQGDRQQVKKVYQELKKLDLAAADKLLQEALHAISDKVRDELES